MDVQCYELFGGIALKNHVFLFHPIVVTFIPVGFQGEGLGPATAGFAGNCPLQEAGHNEGVRLSGYANC